MTTREYKPILFFKYLVPFVDPCLAAGRFVGFVTLLKSGHKAILDSMDDSVLLLCPPLLCGKNYHGGTEITKIHRRAHERRTRNTKSTKEFVQ